MTLKQLYRKLDKYRNTVKLHPKFHFRGQTNSKWTLRPTIARIAGDKKLSREKTLQLEKESILIFSTNAQIRLPIEQTIKLVESQGINFQGWWSIMQHYGAPTRYLDWSMSPWVALYFASQGEVNTDAALWICNHDRITAYGQDEIIAYANTKVSAGELLEFSKLGRDKKVQNGFHWALTDANSPELVQCVTSLNPEQRLDIQQGRFSVATNPLSDHKDIMEASGSLEKVVIPAHLKEEIRFDLLAKNISSKTLFPGVDGLGKYMNEFAYFWDESSVVT